MSSYTAPTVAYIRLRAGLNTFIEDLTDGELDAKLTSLLPAAQTRCALNTTQAIFASSDLSTIEVQALTDAVALRTAAMYLRSPMVEKMTGSQEPLLMEESTNLRQIALDMEGEAEELESAVRTAIEEAAGEIDSALPSFGTGLLTIPTYEEPTTAEEWLIW